MRYSSRLCLVILSLSLVFRESWCWYNGGYRRDRSRQIYSYPRDWDIDWRQRSDSEGWRAGDPVPEYVYRATTPHPVLRPRVEVVPPPGPQDSRGVWLTHQRGSVVIPHNGAAVRVTPQKTTNNKKMYKGVVRSSLEDRQRRKEHRSHKHKNRGQLRYNQGDEPRPRHNTRHNTCARCPSDRAVLAKKGATSVLMETPPIIPCHPWSSIEKVKSEVLAGPQPGDRVPEGSHKIVIRLYRHRRTLATCVTRYNVIVRKCPELEVSPGVVADCPLGKAWGAQCNMSCPVGYLLEGDSRSECSDDLEWSGTLPQCIQSTQCPVPVAPPHSDLSCRTPRHQPAPPTTVLPDGTVCHYRCRPGYTVPPALAHLSRIRCVAGSWDQDQDPVCVETNELEEEEELSPDIDANDALSFDGENCPEDFCQNGGKCIVILEEPMCSCKSGYSGTQCEENYLETELEPDEDLDTGTDSQEPNTIT